MEKLKEGQIITFDIVNQCSGKGVIRGIAMNDMPHLGFTYIIEIIDSKGIDFEVYPYTHMVIADAFIKVN